MPHHLKEGAPFWAELITDEEAQEGRNQLKRSSAAGGLLFLATLAVTRLFRRYGFGESMAVSTAIGMAGVLAGVYLQDREVKEALQTFLLGKITYTYPLERIK
jgi:hypothetical protein